jgi:hypothetical protein
MSSAKFTYSIDCFADLRRDHATYEELRVFLESAEGGSLRVIPCKDSTNVIITYQQVTVGEGGEKVKSIPTADLFEKVSWLRWFQWTTWDTVANLPLSVAPQRSRPFTSDHKDKQMSDILTSYFVSPYCEGRMETTFTLCESDQPAADPRKVHSVYTHTLVTGGEHAVVLKMAASEVVVAEGMVHTDGKITVTATVETVSFDSADELEAELMPMTESVTKFFSKFLAQRDLMYPGWILHDGRGTQHVMLAGFYEKARAMKQISKYVPYRLLELRRRGDLADYLRIFPEDQAAYDDLKKKIYQVTADLLDNYLARWQQKSKGWADISKQYHKHIAAVNNIYHTELKPKHWVVRDKTVIEYINELPAAQLLFLVNRLGV